MTNDSILRQEILEQPAALARFLERERANVARVAAKMAERAPRLIVIAARGSSDNAATPRRMGGGK